MLMASEECAEQSATMTPKNDRREGALGRQVSKRLDSVTKK